MLGLPLAGNAEAPRRILALGCHSDDIEIGCGATLLLLTRTCPDLEVTWVVFGADGARAEEARASAARFLAVTHPVSGMFRPARTRLNVIVSFDC